MKNKGAIEKFKKIKKGNIFLIHQRIEGKEVIEDYSLCDMAISALQAQTDGDCISRQAAIDECNKRGAEHIGYAIAHLPPAQPEPQWIPVSERLPDENDYKSCIECLDGAVWYCTENGTIGLGYYYKSTKEWSTTDDLKTDGKVVAWRPLPEPYRAERRTDE